MTIRCLKFLAMPLALIVMLASGIPALACMWIYGTDLDGKKVSSGGHIEDLSKVTPETRLADWTNRLEYFQERMAKTPDVKNRSDYAAALIHVGELQLGINLLEEIERSDPGLYVTAANLGTAFELSGNNEKALEWISAGIKRNPESHFGSEWVHVKILEAKIALTKDPAWIETHSVLGLDFGSAPRPELPSLDHLDKKLNHNAVKSAIAYQLHERLGFIAAPDPIVGELLFDLANLHALTTMVEVATPVYDLALKFGVKNPELARARKDHLAGVLKAKEQQAAAAKAEQKQVHADRLAAYTPTASTAAASSAAPNAIASTATAALSNPPLGENAQPRRTAAIAALVACTILASAGIIILTLRQSRRATQRRRIPARKH